MRRRRAAPCAAATRERRRRRPTHSRPGVRHRRHVRTVSDTLIACVLEHDDAGTGRTHGGAPPVAAVPRACAGVAASVSPGNSARRARQALEHAFSNKPREPSSTTYALPRSRRLCTLHFANFTTPRLPGELVRPRQECQRCRGTLLLSALEAAKGLGPFGKICSPARRNAQLAALAWSYVEAPRTGALRPIASSAKDVRSRRGDRDAEGSARTGGLVRSGRCRHARPGPLGRCASLPGLCRRPRQELS